jgi:hypothetical protein
VPQIPPGKALDVLYELVRRDSEAIDKLVDPFLTDARITLVTTLVMAGADAMLRVMGRYKEPLSARLRRWLGGLLYEYRLRCADPKKGEEPAGEWLIRILQKGPPRRSRSEDRDANLVRTTYELRLRLAPIFARPWRSTDARNAEARPIVEAVLGPQVKALPRHEKLDSFVADLVHEPGHSAEQRWKVERRFWRRHSEALEYTERRLRIALRASDSKLAAVGFTRLSLTNELDSLREYRADPRRWHRPPQKTK